MAQWNQAAKARGEFIEMYESLSESQRQEASLCDGWSAEGVMFHLASFVETSAFGFVKHMAKGAGNFDKVSKNMVDEQAARAKGESLAALKAKAAKGAPMPGFPEVMTTADVVIHTQDVRRPLKIDQPPSPELLKATLDFLTTQKQAKQMVDLKPMANVRLEASDSDWAFGTGAVITGKAEAIMMALANRPVLDELSGDGLANWR